MDGNSKEVYLAKPIQLLSIVANRKYIFRHMIFKKIISHERKRPTFLK